MTLNEVINQHLEDKWFFMPEENIYFKIIDLPVKIFIIEQHHSLFFQCKETDSSYFTADLLDSQEVIDKKLLSDLNSILAKQLLLV